VLNIRWLGAVLVARRYLAIVGSLFDLAGLQIGRRLRKALFRPLSGALAGSLYRRVTGISRLKATLGGAVAGCLYRIAIYGLEDLPKGGFLMVGNHSCVFDIALLQLACPRPMHILARESVCQHRWVNPVLNLVGSEAIPISESRAKEAIQEAVDHIKNGGIVCVFPEGELSRTGTLLKLQKGFELIGRLAECDVVPVWLDGLSNSIFSFAHGKKFLRNLTQIPLRAAVAFDKPISGRSADSGVLRQRLVELSEFCFQRRPELSVHLARATVNGLKPHPFDDAFIDGDDDRCEKRGDLLATGIALSRWIKRACTDERVAIALPPGPGAVVANVAVTLAGKTPVNLDFNTSGSAAFESTINRSQLPPVISSEAVAERLADLPRHKDFYRLKEVIAGLKAEIIFWRIVSLLTPACLLSDLLRLPRKGDQKEALVFFTADSSGKPAGIMLSHRNVIGSVVQWSSTLKMGRKDSLMASPSVFRAGGDALTLWYPVIKGIRTVICSELIDADKSAELIERYAVTLLVTTPKMVRGYLERAHPKQLESVQILITASEKLAQEQANAFEQKFHKCAFTGYGLAKTASVFTTNLPDPAKIHPDDTLQPRSRAGSVGKLMPGQAAQIRNPETGEVLSPHESGVLWLKGANIFAGYLNQRKKNIEVFRDGWFQTGDLARFDEDGFLYIEGPVSRFSEIGQIKWAEERITADSTRT
jgi:acyl-[acyl-carrier-protein]-phospholipid O-acyltransferase / long-chain-fatty-acid--[acyl-carrier-protein] ligase